MNVNERHGEALSPMGEYGIVMMAEGGLVLVVRIFFCPKTFPGFSLVASTDSGLVSL
jgi:hypothetical protein